MRYERIPPLFGDGSFSHRRKVGPSVHGHGRLHYRVTVPGYSYSFSCNFLSLQKPHPSSASASIVAVVKRYCFRELKRMQHSEHRLCRCNRNYARMLGRAHSAMSRAEKNVRLRRVPRGTHLSGLKRRRSATNAAIHRELVS